MKNSFARPDFVFTLIMILTTAFPGCRERFGQENDVMRASYWTDQAMNDILPPWTHHARDTVYGAFLTSLDGEWQPLSDQRKYPSMIGRHLFSYSVGYLLTGQYRYLEVAEELRTYLLNCAWDKEYGGWFDVLNRDGTPHETTKNMFIQTYALTGLAMYYFVTRDQQALDYIERSNTLIETHLWDQTDGGYFNRASRDWAVVDSNKSFASQVAPVSGYLLYGYLATLDEYYLSQSQRIMNVVIHKMHEPGSRWILESYDHHWEYIPGHPDEINIGHNLETAWVLMRLYQLTHESSCLDPVTMIREDLAEKGFDPIRGFWYKGLARQNTEEHDDFTYWWIQAYGNMFNLMLYRIDEDPRHVRDFEKGARLWDEQFIDRKYGDTYMSVGLTGEEKDARKANPYKTSYHSMEQCLLNYVYLSLWVNHEPVALYFSINTERERDTLYPNPVEDRDIRIMRAYSVTDGREFCFDITGQAVVIPGPGRNEIAVVLGSQPASDRGF